MLPLRQAVRHRTLTPARAGSNPVGAVANPLQTEVCRGFFREGLLLSGFIFRIYSGRVFFGTGCASRGEEVSCKQHRSSAKESQVTLCLGKTFARLKNIVAFLSSITIPSRIQCLSFLKQIRNIELPAHS